MIKGLRLVLDLQSLLLLLLLETYRLTREKTADEEQINPKQNQIKSKNNNPTLKERARFQMNLGIEPELKEQQQKKSLNDDQIETSSLRQSAFIIAIAKSKIKVWMKIERISRYRPKVQQEFWWCGTNWHSTRKLIIYQESNDAANICFLPLC